MGRSFFYPIYFPLKPFEIYFTEDVLFFRLKRQFPVGLTSAREQKKVRVAFGGLKNRVAIWPAKTANQRLLNRPFERPNAKKR
jgi:hypothetical protein